MKSLRSRASKETEQKHTQEDDWEHRTRAHPHPHWRLAKVASETIV